MPRLHASVSIRLALAICAGAGVSARAEDAAAKKVDVKPEVSIAALIQQFQKDADAFTARRRVIVRERQALLDETEEDTARAKIRSDELLALWRLTGQNDKVQLYEGAIAASKTAAATLSTVGALVDQHRAAQAALDTQAKFRQDKLSAVAKALTTLGADEPLEDQAKFYVGYLRETKVAIDALQQQATQPPPGSAPPAPPPPTPPAKPTS
jgi:hypothetical protein